MKSDTLYKLTLFTIFLIVGTVLSGGNLIIGIFAGIVIISAKEAQEAYEQGKRDR